MITAALIGAVGNIRYAHLRDYRGASLRCRCRGDLFRRCRLSGQDLDRLETGRLVTPHQRRGSGARFLAMLIRILVRAPLLVIGSFFMAVLALLSLLIVAICPWPLRHSLP